MKELLSFSYLWVLLLSVVFLFISSPLFSSNIKGKKEMFMDLMHMLFGIISIAQLILVIIILINVSWWILLFYIGVIVITSITLRLQNPFVMLLNLLLALIAIIVAYILYF